MKTIEGTYRTVTPYNSGRVHADLICGAVIAALVLIWLGRVL